MIYFTTASVKYWCNFRLPSWQYGRIYGGLPRGVASSETWAPESRFTAYTKKQNKMRLMNWRCKRYLYLAFNYHRFRNNSYLFFLKFPKTISNVIWVSSNGSYRGIFAEIEMCLRGKQFFLTIKNRTKCYEGPSKQKQNKNKKHQKKNFFALSPSKLSLFFRNLFQKNKNITSKNPKTVPNVIMSP